jgi:hypothetical protein
MDWLKIYPCIGRGSLVWVSPMKVFSARPISMRHFAINLEAVRAILRGSDGKSARGDAMTRAQLREGSFPKIYAVAFKDNFAKLAIFAVLKRDAIAGLQLTFALTACLIEIEPLAFYGITAFFAEQLVAAIFIQD